MADSFAYHSPQFSLDPAWLPPWLQPHQLPLFRGHKNEANPLLQESNNAPESGSLDENTNKGQEADFVKENESYQILHLHLSGDDETPSTSTPAETDFNFHLHLSSESTFESSRPRSDKASQMGRAQKNETVSIKPVLETAPIQKGNGVLEKIEVEMSEQEKSSMGSKLAAKPLTSVDQKNRKRLQRHFEAKDLSKTVDEAIEFSIAASEAMVISEMVSINGECLAPEAVLEIALRVKQARKECYLETGSGFASSGDTLDDIDELLTFNDSIMKEAFEDVGFNVTQVINSPGFFPCERETSQQTQVLESSSPCDFNMQTTVSLHEKEKSAQNEDVDLQNPFICEINVPQVMNVSQSQFHKTKSKEDQVILKDGSINQNPRPTSKKCLKGLFVGETSFISESIDLMDENGSLHQPLGDLEIVASSTNAPACSYKGKDTPDVIFSSNDFVRLCGVSSGDPLCSLVPCSISMCSDNNINTQINSEGDLREINYLGDDLVLASSKMPSPTNSQDVDDEHTFLCNNSLVGSCPQSARKHVTLKHYSMVSPTLDALKEMNKNSLSSLGMEGQANMSVSVKETNSYMHLDRQNDVSASNPGDSNSHENCIGTEDVDGELPIVPDSEDDLLLKEKEQQSTMIIKRHRQMTRSMILNGVSVDAKRKTCSNLKMKKHNGSLVDEAVAKVQGNTVTQVDVQVTTNANFTNKRVRVNKRVRFLEADDINHQMKTGGAQLKSSIHSSRTRSSKRLKKSSSSYKPEVGRTRSRDGRGCSVDNEKLISRSSKRLKRSSSSYKPEVGRTSSRDGRGRSVDNEKLIFYGLEFLLTGFSSCKKKELEILIRDHGGYVLQRIPACSVYSDRKYSVETPDRKFPIVLSPKKVQTERFLYGCAINTWTLNPKWVTDTVRAGHLLQPVKYMTRRIIQTPLEISQSYQSPCSEKQPIFDRVGVMLYGKVGFCSKFAKAIKYGGGQVFKSLEKLIHSLNNGENTIAVFLVENEAFVSRHLKHCAAEHNLQMMSASWIIDSLFSGNLLPLKKDRCAPLYKIKMPTFQQDQFAISQEI